MDTEQLKLLAGHVRSLIKQANRSVGHNQSLDLIAALPGLRNWPEVIAFPDRVSACKVDGPGASRLAYRLKRNFQLELSPQEILTALLPQQARTVENTLQIWPGGPASGVYVTTSQAAINALVAKYEEASDGALLYAERAANAAAGAIDLGDYGLWSSGLDRVPSGTLIVVGPMELAQDEWSRSAERLQMACTHAEISGHRVAVLIKTPVPDDLYADIRVLANTNTDYGPDNEAALRGMVTENGELQERIPFSLPWPGIKPIRSVATLDAIPTGALGLLSRDLRTRKAGILVFGADSVQGHWAADLVDAGLALTEHAGPAARIMPRFRSTPEKDWWVPDATKQLPFLPSIESAYDRGYRRMIIDPHQCEGDVLAKYAEDVLFLAGTHGYETSTMMFTVLRGMQSADNEVDFLRYVIGLLGVARIPTSAGARQITDLFLGQGGLPEGVERPKDIAEYVEQHRSLKWEDEVRLLLDRHEISTADLQSQSIRPPMLTRFTELVGNASNAKLATH